MDRRQSGAQKKLLENNIPAPRGASVSSLDEALALFETLEKPVITKPRSGSRGRHTTTMVYTADQLKDAFTIAQMISPHVVLEEHIFGSVYRGTVIGGELIGVLAGDPPRVTGDGASTVRELIEKKNAARPQVIHEYKINPLTETFLKRSGYTLESVIPAGVTVDLSEKIGTSYGGSSTELFDTAHPKIKEYLKRAGAVVNDNLVGFDFIIPDPTADPDTQKWGIIECNTLPFINLHHDPVNGTPRNVAKHVWDLWIKE
jgi:cyanophycin synthetase